MFSLVQNIASVFRPYEVEAANARLGKQQKDIAEHAEEHHTRHHEQEEETDDDFSVFSVKALIRFFEDFLEARLSARLKAPVLHRQNGEIQNLDTLKPWLRTHHGNDSAPVSSKNAVNAYRHASEISRRVTPKRETEAENDDETKKIYRLIKDLRLIEKATLKIDNRKHFIEAVSLAVEREKSAQG